MPTTVNASEYLEYLGVSLDELHALKKLGVRMQFVGTNLVFYYDPLKEIIFRFKPAKFNSLSNAKSISEAIVKGQKPHSQDVDSAVAAMVVCKAYLKKVVPAEIASPPTFIPVTKKFGAPVEPQEALPDIYEANPLLVVQGSLKPSNPYTQIGNVVNQASGPVELEEATYLLQSVNGSTAGSVYYVAALHNKHSVKVAVRHTKKKLSVRVSPVIYGSQLELNLKECGLLPVKNKYASGHFVVSGASASMTFGAVLGALDIGWDWEICNLNKIPYEDDPKP